LIRLILNEEPRLTRSHNAILNYLSTIFFMIVTVAMGLVSTPLLIKWLGKDTFGVFRILVAYFGYLSLLEFGLSGGVSPILARYLGVNDEEGIVKTMAAAARAYFRVTILTVFGGLLLSTLIVRFNLIKFDSTGSTELYTACVIYLLGFSTLYLIPFRSLIEADQKTYVIVIILSVQSLLVTALSLFFAYRGWGLRGQALATAIGTVAFYIAVVGIEARRLASFLKRIASPSDPAVKREIRSLSRPSLIINISGRLSLMSDDIILGAILGADLVSRLYVTQRMAILAHGQLLGLGAAAWAGLANLHARGEMELFRLKVIEVTKTIVAASIVLLAPIVAYNHAFVALWVGEDMYGNGGSSGLLVISIAAINAVIIALNSFWGWTFSGTGKVGMIARQSVYATLINISASVYCTTRFGIVGPILGTTIATLGVSMWYLPWKMKKTFDVSLTHLAKAVFAPLCLGFVAVAILSKLAAWAPPHGWLELIVAMSLSALSCLIAVMFICFNQDERERWISRFAGLAAKIVRRNRPSVDEASADLAPASLES
jgi:O-antigen/teichoic acid export membrane protein